MKLFCIFLLSIFFSYAETTSMPQIECKTSALLDEEIEVKVTGLTPGQVVLIECSWISHRNVQWSSEAVFQADDNGIISLSKQAPIVGSYDGVDSMGLFWAMNMKNVRPDFCGEDFCGDLCIPFSLSVFNGKKLVASETICRCFINESIESEIIDHEGLIGELFLPPSDEALPVVIVLTGSNGGVQAGTAGMIASHGLPAFALAYSGIGDLPPYVEDVSLEYFEAAFEWIDNHPKLNGKIYLYGTSRGAELALVLGSFFPDRIDKIVALAPSNVVLSTDSWLYENEPILPAAPFFIDVNNDPTHLESTKEHPRSIRVHRERGLVLEREKFAAAEIPVEKIQCPILLISGGDDQLGPCSTYSELILQRLEKHGSKVPCWHLDFQKAGHLISSPYLPRINVLCSDGVWMAYGGTPSEDENASRESWRATLDFFFEEISHTLYSEIDEPSHEPDQALEENSLVGFSHSRIS